MRNVTNIKRAAAAGGPDDALRSLKVDAVQAPFLVLSTADLLGQCTVRTVNYREKYGKKSLYAMQQQWKPNSNKLVSE